MSENIKTGNDIFIQSALTFVTAVQAFFSINSCSKALRFTQHGKTQQRAGLGMQVGSKGVRGLWMEPLRLTQPHVILNISKLLSLNKHSRPLLLQKHIINIERSQKPVCVDSKRAIRRNGFFTTLHLEEVQKSGKHKEGRTAAGRSHCTAMLWIFWQIGRSGLFRLGWFTTTKQRLAWEAVGFWVEW